MRFSWAMVVAACLALMPLPAVAGSFDGKWIAEIPPQRVIILHIPFVGFRVPDAPNQFRFWMFLPKLRRKLLQKGRRHLPAHL